MSASATHVTGVGVSSAALPPDAVSNAGSFSVMVKISVPVAESATLVGFVPVLPSK
jgi:hypothetical protein